MTSKDEEELSSIEEEAAAFSRMMAVKPVFSIGHVSVCSLQAKITANVEDGPWIESGDAKNHFASVLTAVYAMLVTIFALSLEIADSFSHDHWLAEMLFYLYMYTTGLAFYSFCYIFMLYPGWLEFIRKVLKKIGIVSGENIWIYFEKASHTGEGAGSLYLRLGAICFGTVGIVFCGLEIFLCIKFYHCHKHDYVRFILGGLFTFVQMHFIFCNSKIRINGSHNYAKFGAMHVVSVNIWTWFRYVVQKQVIKKQKKALQHSEEEDLSNDYEMAQLFVPSDLSNPDGYPCSMSAIYFSGASTVMTTCIIEYSLIGAAVLFVLWKSIGDDISHPVCPSIRSFSHHGRKHHMRVDCSASSSGLFAGLLFLIVAFISVGVMSGLHQLKQTAHLVFSFAELALFFVLLIGCVLGMWRMRQLSYSHKGHGNAEVLDEILLVVGLIGELLYCMAGLINFIALLYTQQIQPFYVALLYLFRTAEVLLQTVFILMSSRLRAISPIIQQRLPGKQFVTFLLVANVSLFLFHTLQGESVGYGEDSALFYDSFLIQAVTPLIVFYRFHSSVVLAEIWKHCYSIKEKEMQLTMRRPSSSSMATGVS